MTLRLSGILMGGVVIVYERKVKLLYDDVTRPLVEINEAWKVKAAPDPRDRTLLPKSKTQAKKEAVALPEPREEDVGGIEQSLDDLSKANATMGFDFHRSAYFAMQLDDVDGSYFNIDPKEEVRGEHFHQAEEFPDHHGCKDEQRQGPIKRKPRKQAGMAMDYEQTVIPGNIYQPWFQNAHDIVSRRGTKKKVSRDIISTMKVGSLVGLPPIIFIVDSSSYRNQDIYYPKSLVELWMKSTQPVHESPSGSKDFPTPASRAINIVTKEASIPRGNGI